MGLFGVNMGFVDVFEVYYLLIVYDYRHLLLIVYDYRHLLLKAMIKNSKPDIAFIFIKK
jgi:hypothetical protein